MSSAGLDACVQVKLEVTDMHRPFAAIMALLILTADARADGLADCSQRADLQRTIDGCTHVLDGDNLSDRLRAMALNNRANALAALSLNEEALADYSKSIAIHSELAQTHLNRGVTLMNMGELAAAIADFDRALQIDPTLDKAKVSRTLAQLRSGRMDRNGSQESHPVPRADATEEARARRNLLPNLN
jgi:lipoprotein NlpI